MRRRFVEGMVSEGLVLVGKAGQCDSRGRGSRGRVVLNVIGLEVAISRRGRLDTGCLEEECWTMVLCERSSGGGILRVKW